ncbi:hypothetical protein HYY75_02360, partial [bacterium]|nr:hypothetical protein [bacterium]
MVIFDAVPQRTPGKTQKGAKKNAKRNAKKNAKKNAKERRLKPAATGLAATGLRATSPCFFQKGFASREIWNLYLAVLAWLILFFCESHCFALSTPWKDVFYLNIQTSIGNPRDKFSFFEDPPSNSYVNLVPVPSTDRAASPYLVTEQESRYEFWWNRFYARTSETRCYEKYTASGDALLGSTMGWNSKDYFHFKKDSDGIWLKEKNHIPFSITSRLQEDLIKPKILVEFKSRENFGDEGFSEGFDVNYTIGRLSIYSS